ncbi:hypothetical protein [Streptomyces sp. NPDC058644]|uniref:hypothetical protein n=1 Tax=unclassified Streptomyces TaxID=2593676 RepID=UPI003651B4C4
MPDSVTPEQYVCAPTEGSGTATPPDLTPQRLRAVATSMRERSVWEAAVSLKALQAALWPALRVSKSTSTVR